MFFLEDLVSLEEIATLYRRFKNSLDNTKDYEQAGWFYFNEFEMRRKACIENSKSKFRKLKPRHMLYSMYRVFAGYGEKPLLSTFWFFLFWTMFSVLNMFSGIQLSDGRLINYNVNFDFSEVYNPIKDFGYSALFTITKIIPADFFPLLKDNYNHIGPDGLILSLLSSVILILFIVFIGIGLQRIFRRF